MIPNLLLTAFTYPLSLVTGVRQGLPLQVLSEPFTLSCLKAFGS